MKKTVVKKRKIYSPTKQKMILLLSAGISLGFARTPKSYFRILDSCIKEWNFINRRALYQMVKTFHRDRIIEWEEHKDGTTYAILTGEGQQRVLEFNFHSLCLRSAPVWDKKWRIVFFDIPEKFRGKRDVFRAKLNELGFREYQKSLFTYPYECRDEIDFVIEYLDLRRFVRYAEMISPTNEAELKILFHLK